MYKALQGLDLENFHQCPFCDNAYIIDNNFNNQEDNLRVFNCTNCKKVSCILCKKMLHDGPCDKTLHLEAELETKKLVIKCCCFAIIRGDDCNKVKCKMCCTLWCWICKTKIKDYTHFNSPTYDGKIRNCILYGEPKSKGLLIPVQVQQLPIQNHLCIAITKKSIPCVYKSKTYSVYCGKHIRE